MPHSHIARLLVLFLLLPAGAQAEDFRQDLMERRARAMQMMGADTIMILWSAPYRTYSRNINYEYRQDSDLYYFTGVEQDGTILVLMPGNPSRREILFIKRRDPAREHWQGKMLTPEEAASATGIATVWLNSEFEAFVDAILSARPYGLPPDSVSAEYDAFFKALSTNAGRLFLLLDPRPRSGGTPGPAYEFSNKVRERFPGIKIQDGTAIMRDLRMIKTAYEQKILRRSVEIAAEAQKAAMAAARPGMHEYQVKAVLEYTYRSMGAMGWSYPPIVGSGPNANILHYEGSARLMQPGDLLLVDAAANYQYLTGDITRTYPVSGTFTAEQKDVYRIVLRAQDEARKIAKPGATLGELQSKVAAVIREGLLQLGLITDPKGDQYRTWLTHGTSHFIGMDVHDVGNAGSPLVPGMAFVMEPGIYVREGALENLPKTPENAAFIEKVRPAFEKYRNIGIRIEDSFLMTEAGLECLSAGVPRTIEEVEAFMRSRSPIPGRIP